MVHRVTVEAAGRHLLRAVRALRSQLQDPLWVMSEVASEMDELVIP